MMMLFVIMNSREFTGTFIRTGVIFVPSHLPPVRYLLNMHKNDNIHKVKHELQNVVGLQDCDIIMAEVLDCHISRILVSHAKNYS